MFNVIQEFMDSAFRPPSSNLFAEDEKAKQIAGGLTKKQRKKFKHHGIVPAAFYLWMREVGIIRKDASIPKGGTALGYLLDFLRWYPYETEQARSAGEYIFRQIIRERTGLPNSAFGLGDYQWQEVRDAS